MSDYAWIIDKDHLADDMAELGIGDEKGTIGPRDANLTQRKRSEYDANRAELTANYQNHAQFRMYDDDSELYYTGTLYWNGPADSPAEHQCYGPLGDFGMPNAGAVSIRYTGRPHFDCG